MAPATSDDPVTPGDGADGSGSAVGDAPAVTPGSPRAPSPQGRQRSEELTTEDPPDDAKRSIEALRELLMKLLDDHDGDQ